ncbi:hemerythrin domain-containing protein [Blastococcus sp. SYSU D00820]
MTATTATTPTTGTPATGTAPAGTQLDLPGQTHVAEGPNDLSGMYVAHHAFRRDLAAFARAAERTPVTDGESWRALAARWQRFAKVLHHHHTVEDTTLWPQLLELADAAGDPQARETLEAMEAEHALIDPLLEACAAGFGAMATTPGEDVRAELARQTAAARDSLTEHLRHEETEALPLVQRVLPAEGWARVEEAAGKGGSLSDLAFLIPWAAQGLPRAATDRAFAAAGPVFRLVLKLFGGRFARAEAVAFRHA